MKLLIVLVLLLLAWAFDAVLPPDPAVAVAAPPAWSVAGSAGAAPAHGAFCAAGDGGPVYLGRDARGRLTYQEFARWCEARGGVTGWAA